MLDFIPSILAFADVDFTINFETNFDDLNLDDDERYLLSLEPQPKLDITYPWSEYEWSFDWRKANVICFMTDGPYWSDPDLRHSNMRPYLNIVGDNEFYMYIPIGSFDGPDSSHAIVLELLNNNFDINAEFASAVLIERVFIGFIDLTEKVTAQAIRLLLDSYMLDVDGITIRCVSIY